MLYYLLTMAVGNEYKQYVKLVLSDNTHFNHI